MTVGLYRVLYSSFTHMYKHGRIDNLSRFISSEKLSPSSPGTARNNLDNITGITEKLI